MAVTASRKLSLIAFVRRPIWIPHSELPVMSTPTYKYYAGGQWRAAEGNAQFNVLQPYDRPVFARVEFSF